MPADIDPEHDAADFTFGGGIPPKLAKFRDMTGINTPKALVHGELVPRPAKNIGLYARVVAEESKTNWQYWIMNGIIEASFLGQIAIAACLTALGAADGSHIAITVLGSANTVVAGVQTYLKGQGMPNRLKQYIFGLRKLREHIEDLERHFSHPECKLNVDHEISDIAAMYHSVRQTAEDNTPDTYLPMAGAGAKLLGLGGAKSNATNQASAQKLSPSAESSFVPHRDSLTADKVPETSDEELAKPSSADSNTKAKGNAKSIGEAIIIS